MIRSINVEKKMIDNNNIAKTYAEVTGMTLCAHQLSVMATDIFI